MGLDLFSLLASLCEGGGPAGPEGESLAMTRNISGRRKVLSPTRCGGSPLPEGAKRGGHAPLWIYTTHGLSDGHDGRARRRNARQQPLQCAGLIQQRCHHGDGLAPGLGVKHRILIFIEGTA